MTKRTLAVLAVLAAFSGCGSLAIEGDAPARVDAALKAYSASLLAMDADGIAAAYTPEGELQDPGHPPVTGPDAIRAFLRSFTGVTVEEQEFKVSALQVVGPDALQRGTFRQKARLADGKTVESKGTFEAEWERQPNGTWLLARMTTNPPPFEPTKAGEVP